MKTSKKESIKAILILVSVLVILMIVIPSITWMSIGWMVGNTEKGLREELDNAVIDGDYAGWKKAEVADWKQFLIPEEWNIREEEDMLRICDRDGNELGFGAMIGNENAAFADYKTFLEAVEGAQEIEVSESAVEEFATISESTMVKVTAKSDAGEKNYYCIRLLSQTVNDSRRLCMFFPEDEVINFEEFFEKAQAIVFSFAFAVEPAKSN